MQISITGEADLNSRLQKLSKAEFFDALLADTAQQLFNAAEQGAARHSKTGTLERALGSGAEKVGDRTYQVAVDGSIAPYGIFVHWGTRPHDIFPSKRKALRWVSGNSFVFAKWSKHPGTAGDPFLVNAVSNVLRDFESLAQKHVKDL